MAVNIGASYIQNLPQKVGAVALNCEGHHCFRIHWIVGLVDACAQLRAGRSCPAKNDVINNACLLQSQVILLAYAVEHLARDILFDLT